MRSLALALAALLCSCAAVACATLSPASKEQIAKDQIELGVCAAEAHVCKMNVAVPAKCWAVFDDCMTRKGFYDGGADAR